MDQEICPNNEGELVEGFFVIWTVRDSSCITTNRLEQKYKIADSVFSREACSTGRVTLDFCGLVIYC